MPILRVAAILGGMGILLGGLPTTAAAKDSAPARILTAGDIAACNTEGFLADFNDAVDVFFGMPEEPQLQKPRGANSTAELMDQHPGLVLPLGDLAYPDGTLEQFETCYDPTWGRHRDRTRPVPGNHEYKTPDAAGYFAYWGKQAGELGKGYYSYQHGTWLVLALNSEIDVAEGSEQLDWVKRQLTGTDRRCVLAYYHRPRFASGHHGSDDKVEDLFRTLYDHGVSVVLNGHEHHYERLHPVNPDGEVEPFRGVRHFIVGTGGGGLRKAKARQQTAAIESDGWGLLSLELRRTGYAWEFLPVNDRGFEDSGEASCVNRHALGLIQGAQSD